MKRFIVRVNTARQKLSNTAVMSRQTDRCVATSQTAYLSTR